MTCLTSTVRRASLLASLSVAAACGDARKPDASAERVKVRVASQAYLSHAPLFIGIRDSIFAAHGIDIEVVSLGGTEALPLLLAGEVDVVTATLSPGALNAMADGQSVRIVAARGVFRPERCSLMAIAHRTGGAPRKGRPTISIDRDLAMQFLVEEAMARVHQTLDTMQVIFVSGTAELEALRQGTLDYALTGEPWMTRARRDGHSTPWIVIDSLMAGAQHGFVLYGPSIIERNHALGERFMTAYLEATRRYMQGPEPRNVEIVASVTGDTPELLREACWPTMSTDGRVDTADVEVVQRWALARHYMQKAATPAQFWDSSFVVAAERSSIRTGGRQ
jgi:NitT/TauT family transport system substrate-binding protein